MQSPAYARGQKARNPGTQMLGVGVGGWDASLSLSFSVSPFIPPFLHFFLPSSLNLLHCVWGGIFPFLYNLTYK